MMTDNNTSTKYCKCGCGQVVKNQYVHGHNAKGRKVSEETKKKISLANIGENNGMFGVKQTDEWKENLSKKMTGRVITWKDKLSIANIGKHNIKISPEHIEKLRQSHLGKPLSQEHKKILREAHLGNGSITNAGYRMLIFYGKQILEHNHVWIKHNECPIPKGFVVHHINGNKLDNKIENLACLPRGYHTKLHFKLREIEREKQRGII